jgi:pyrroloquinoline-quinone synthase
MDTSEIDRVLARALVGRWLLDHPFYRRWEGGEVSAQELGAYAAQYRHFESYLPGFLGQLTDALPAGPAREMVAATLADERGDPIAHVDLFESFARAVGAGDDAPSPATLGLFSTYDDLLAGSSTSALAGFLAYESQSAQIARSKAAGLRRHYHLDDSGVQFWDHHARVDARHGAWAREALAASVDASDGMARDIRRGADAWWAFLDERQACSSPC